MRVWMWAAMAGSFSRIVWKSVASSEAEPSSAPERTLEMKGAVSFVPVRLVQLARYSSNSAESADGAELANFFRRSSQELDGLNLASCSNACFWTWLMIMSLRFYQMAERQTDFAIWGVRLEKRLPAAE
jgi:hypothetical protein